MAARRASSLFIRSLVHRPPLPLSPCLSKLASAKTLTTTTSPSPWQPQPQHHHHQCRCFCSATSSIAYLKSDHEFSNSLAKVKDDRVPAIFYFTAAWCGPCRLLSPVIEDLSTKYPHVNIYKIDVDQKELEVTLSDLRISSVKELEVTLSDLRISSVPTLHFFHEGKKATEIVGADVALLKKVMEDYYK